jgi:hypothetical protein
MHNCDGDTACCQADIRLQMSVLADELADAHIRDNRLDTKTFLASVLDWAEAYTDYHGERYQEGSPWKLE